MVKIRLARFGKKKQPSYRVVATDAKTKRNTLALEYLGSYNPLAQKDKFTFNKERLQYWLDNGAQPSYTVKSLLIKDGFMKADIKIKHSKKKSAVETKKEPKAEKPVEIKTEEIAESPKSES